MLAFFSKILIILVLPFIFYTLLVYFCGYTKELHMFQLNTYKLDLHKKWYKTHKDIYLPYLVLFIISILGLTLKLLIFYKTNYYSLVLEPLIQGVNGVASTREIPRSYFITKLILILLGAVSLIKIIINVNVTKEEKIPLAWTDRARRIVLTSSVLLLVVSILLLFVNIPTSKFWFLDVFNIYFVVSLIPVSVVLANYINAPIEKHIKNKYLNEAKAILKNDTKLNVVGITGSYGKTSMKNFLGELMNVKYNTLITPKNYNTPMGVTITVREYLKPIHEYFLCEMGARRVGEINELCEIANPSSAIITAVGPQHLETFLSIENILKTKFELADYVADRGGDIFLNGDNDLIYAKRNEYKNVISYGINSRNDFHPESYSQGPEGLTFSIDYNGEITKFSSQLLGEHNLINLLGALAYATLAGIKLSDLILPVKRIKPVEHRLQLLPGPITYIDDAYNSNLTGAKSAVDVLSGFSENYRVLLTPGMVELGDLQFEQNFEFAKYACNSNLDKIIFVGETNKQAFSKGAEEARVDRDKCVFAKTLKEALEIVGNIITDKKVVVLLENDLPDNYT